MRLLRPTEVPALPSTVRSFCTSGRLRARAAMVRVLALGALALGADLVARGMERSAGARAAAQTVAVIGLRRCRGINNRSMITQELQTRIL